MGSRPFAKRPELLCRETLQHLLLQKEGGLGTLNRLSVMQSLPLLCQLTYSSVKHCFASLHSAQ